MPDQVIGHYRILEKIGAGAMGEVFRAHDEWLGRDVALKLIRPASNDNPDHRRRFELEARAVSSLNHPNIVAIYEAGFHNGSPYIVSELLEGQTLRKRLSEGALPVRLAIDYSLQIVHGLIAAHDRQITHRDLKPENLFLTTDGRVKILDFGLAKFQPESERSVEELTTATRAGVLLGTPSYMSPEQVRCQKVDHRSDIFSIGSVLYEILTGHLAFKGETTLDTMIAVVTKDPLEIDLQRASIPLPLRQIVRHCLKKEPENRFQSARELAAVLDTASSASERVIGYYRILERIGAGAMGEAFRARDERLGRDVALTLIRPSSNGNLDHLHRLELEARAVASMNHPNIVAIYDVGLDNGALYIVSELLEGQTLRKRLMEGALSVRLTINYSSQIVQGLIAAHRRHIIHRDLRPENLFLTFGRVKIFFGAARLQSQLEESERSVEELTTVTGAYISPEQLRGKLVDYRSDIFSFGTILYEMLTGHRAAQERPPEIDLEQAGVPVLFQQIVQQCLEKEPENRFQSARDLAFALDTLSDASGGWPKRLKVPRPQAKIMKILPWGVAGVLLVAALLLLAKQTPQQSKLSRLTFEEGTVYSARFAPDSHSIVYGAAWNGRPQQLYSTVANSLLPQALTLADANLLAVLPSGELLVALHSGRGAHLQTQGGTLARAPLAGGSPRAVLDNVPSADWGGNNELAVVHHTEGQDQIEYPIGHVLYRSKRGTISHLRLSPHGDRIAFMDHPMQWDDGGWVDTVDLQGHLSVLSPQWSSEDGLAWSPDGKEVWFTAAASGTNRTLFAVDMTGHMRTILALPGVMNLQDIAPDGRVLVSLDAERLALATMARGDTKPVDLSWHDWNVAKDISSDGQWILFEDDSEIAGTHFSTAIRKIDGTPPVKLAEGSPSKLSPDGKWVISIVLGKPGKVSLVPIGVGQPRTVPLPEFEEIHNGTDRFLEDGKHFTLNANEPGHAVRTYLVDLDGKNPIPITPEGTTGILISPDGKYIFRSDSAGALAIYPTAGGTPHIIPDLEPRFYPVQWSEDNSSVYGYIPDHMPIKVYKVNVTTGAKTLVEELQPETTTGAVTITSICVSRDGSRFAYSYYKVSSVLYLISGLH